MAIHQAHRLCVFYRLGAVVYILYFQFSVIAFGWLFTVCAVHRVKCIGNDNHVLQSGAKKPAVNEMVLAVGGLLGCCCFVTGNGGVLMRKHKR